MSGCLTQKRCGVCFVHWQKTNQTRSRRSPLMVPRSLVVCLHMQNAQTATATDWDADKTLAADNGIDKRRRSPDRQILMPRQVKNTSVTEVPRLKKTKGTQELSTVCAAALVSVSQANPFANCYPILSLLPLSLSLPDGGSNMHNPCQMLLNYSIF